MQVRCMEIMLRAGAAMTQEQLTLFLHALPALDSPRVSVLYSRTLPAPPCWSSLGTCLINMHAARD